MYTTNKTTINKNEIMTCFSFPSTTDATGRIRRATCLRHSSRASQTWAYATPSMLEETTQLPNLVRSCILIQICTHYIKFYQYWRNLKLIVWEQSLFFLRQLQQLQKSLRLEAYFPFSDSVCILCYLYLYLYMLLFGCCQVHLLVWAWCWMWNSMSTWRALRMMLVSR